MKDVSRVDEFENVTGIINLYQLLIYKIWKSHEKYHSKNLLEMELSIPDLQFVY